MVCTFAGHREVYAADISKRVDTVVESILRADTDFIFYTGDMGAFDRIGAGAVRRARRAHPNLNIKLILVLPYLTESLHAPFATLANVHGRFSATPVSQMAKPGGTRLILHRAASCG